MPSRPKRNAPRNAQENRRRGCAGICAIPPVKKNRRNPGMASGKKPCAQRDVLRSCPHSGDRAAAAGCPRALKPRARKSAALHVEFPHPFCGSGPAGRGVDQGVRFYRSRPIRRGAANGYTLKRAVFSQPPIRRGAQNVFALHDHFVSQPPIRRGAAWRSTRAAWTLLSAAYPAGCGGCSPGIPRADLSAAYPAGCISGRPIRRYHLLSAAYPAGCTP